ncbi:MAG: hypothetical protein ABI556_15850, partial [Gemmatimonadales bacterium]
MKTGKLAALAAPRSGASGSTGRKLFMVAVASMAFLSACDNALTVVDPDVIDATKVQSAEAAEGLRLGALARLGLMTSGSESSFHIPGLLADEFRSGDTFAQRNSADQRSVNEDATTVSDMWYDVNRTRTAANQAIDALGKYPPALAASLPQNQSNIGLMYWVRGFAETAIAENYCNGTPVSSFDLEG